MLQTTVFFLFSRSHLKWYMHLTKNISAIERTVFTGCIYEIKCSSTGAFIFVSFSHQNWLTFVYAHRHCEGLASRIYEIPTSSRTHSQIRSKTFAWKKKNVHLSITTILSAYYRLALLAQQHKSIDTYACFQYGLILVFIYAERCTQKLLRLYAY